MATLIRPKTVHRDDDDHQFTHIGSSVPAPFPSPEERTRLLALGREEVQVQVQQSAWEGIPSQQQEANPFSDDAAIITVDDSSQSEQPGISQDVMPSIAHVQKSCLMMLNDLLSASNTTFMPSQWQPIVPDRRHSSPAHSRPSQSNPLDGFQSKSALQTLISNLRHCERDPEMVEARLSEDESEMLHELQMRVDALMPSLNLEDGELAVTLVSLLAHLHRLSIIGFASSSLGGTWRHTEMHASGDVFDVLTRQLSDFQLQRLLQTENVTDGVTPVVAVEKALLWTRIDDNLETVLRLCKRRTEGPRRHSSSLLDDHLPPEYDRADYEFEGPPGYVFDSAPGLTDSKAAQQSSASAASVSATMSEKMRLDLDAVTMAIDRLYLVAPQLHNQRVELNSSKLKQLEMARLAGPSTKSSDEKELERIVDMIGKASDRKLANQTVVLEGGMKAQLEKTRQRNLIRRQEFVEKLIEHNAVGRMHSQDASFQPPKLKDTPKCRDPDALLTLPEFIRESIPSGLQRPADPNAMLSLPEFVREAMPESAPPPPPPVSRSSSKKGLRNRSMSAPALNWLLPSGPRPGSETRITKSARSSRPGSSSGAKSLSSGIFICAELHVHYVAEHHESLRHVLAFLTVSGMTPGVNLEAEILNTPESHLRLRSGPITSPALVLPGLLSPGRQDVKVQSMHYEIKLPNAAPLPTTDPLPLLDATQLLASSPTTFICASCSLPLVQSARITRYDDLPSEYWGELVDAWMCHADQKLSAQVARHARGFWPEAGQALVGGSYILFDESAVVKTNTLRANKSTRDEKKAGVGPSLPTASPLDSRTLARARSKPDGFGCQPSGGVRWDDWSPVRCICGSFSGRSQEYTDEDGKTATVYRFFKYAIRPVSPSAEPSRIPLSAFIVEDMNELAQAHATYRFIVLDEEEERPRLLVWLFKPRMRLSYNAPTAYAIPKRGVIQAAKVLFKILGPSTARTDLSAYVLMPSPLFSCLNPHILTSVSFFFWRWFAGISILDRYPGFPQAEQLLYPMEVCQRLAVILTESNKCYPEAMRTMTGLQVGWLLRA
ncbi:hypothetical protein EW146_g1847 [Bondarzewia mesenterica]|uniref:HECT-like ubiquitin-conjugating enzyme-binding-domain-containing protein n=1 Tax=Bondarzewia mesenterica TaxID=1095465 RepID=A0A4S4M400_9AGAM|nr:hypothetical protein EW146_g1847 [Bondarzewia mesenterica]